MAGPMDMLSTGFEPISEQISTFLDDPRGKAALLQFGLQAMQPPAWGQGTGAALASAVGAAGEAVGREEALQRKDLEMQSKAELAEARAGAAQARSGAAAERAGSAASMLELRKKNIELTDENKKNAARNQLVGQYRLHVKSIEDGNKKIDSDLILRPDQKAAMKKKVPSPEQWIKDQGPLIQGLGLSDETEGLVGSDADVGATARTPAPPTRGVPQVGESRGGYRFKGGDPAKQTSWEKE